MYIPNAFKFENLADKIAFMKRYSFATIVTCKDQIPIATQLPFVVNDGSGGLSLSGHFAIANEQAKYIEANTSLVIFAEPHAYISPKHYNKKESVPTWDYISIHAYGRAKIIKEEASKLKALEQMITFYEQSYMEQWQDLSEKFKKGMMQGIVAFEMEVTSLQGQQKLSQNKMEEERERIIQHLEKGTNNMEKELAPFIRNLSK